GNTNATYAGYFTYRSVRIPDLYPHPAAPVADLVIGHISMDRLSADEWKTVNEIKAQRDKARAAGTGKMEKKEAK
ncbi:MAG: hypothetical protein LAP21_09395, partial [Acidobacteriia bacterium]|nr:hypothetical protein [Terriglobia bacterium]